MKKLFISILFTALTLSFGHANASDDTESAFESEIDSAINSLIKSSSGDRDFSLYEVVSMPKAHSSSGADRLPTWQDLTKPSPDLTYSFSAYNDYLVLKTYWKKSAEFPKPAQSGTFDNTVYRYSQDGVSINSTKDYIEIKADSFDKIVEHMGNYKQAIPLLNRSGWRYPNIKSDPYSYSFEFDLKKMAFYPPFIASSPVKAGEKLSTFDVNTSTVIGYRVGNGELKPVVHDMMVYDYSELKDADRFMIYAKAGKGDMKLSAAAIEVDKPQGRLKVYRTYPFPNK